MLGDRGLLCMDWDERSLRILDVSQSRSGVKVRQGVHVPLPAGVNDHDPAAMGAFIRRTLAEHRIRTRRAVVDIPRQEAFLNLMSMPGGTIEEMASMVHMQAVKELPFARDQAVIDFAVARPASRTAMAEVWVAAVRAATVDRYRQTVAEAGLKLESIGLRPLANGAGLPKDLSEGKRLLLVDIGPSISEIDVLMDGRLIYSRAASVNVPPRGLGGTAETETGESGEPAAEDTIPLVGDNLPRVEPLDALIIEVNRTVEAYRATAPGATFDGIILAGSVGIDEEVISRFERRFGLSVRVYEAPEALRWRRGRALADAAPFSAVLGLALTDDTEPLARFDFLHPKEPAAVERVRRRRRPLVVVTVALFVAAGAVIAYTPIHRKKVERDSLKRVLAELNKDSRDREMMFKQLKDVRDWQARDYIWIDQLARLLEVFPDSREAYILEARFTEKGQIFLELAARDEKVATRIVEAVSGIRDRNGRPLYSAKPGGAEKNKARLEGPHAAYPVKDQVIIQIEALPS